MSTEVEKEKKTSKKSAVVYLGHIPNDFQEVQMREFFQQFGTIKHLRLSRSKKTGGSKHYGFIEFETPEVAEIAADTMNNYYLFGQKLVCEVMKPSDIHPEIWKGANKRFVPKRINLTGSEFSRENLGESLDFRVAYNKKIQSKLQEMGITYDFLQKHIDEDEALLKGLNKGQKKEEKEEKEVTGKKEKPVVKRVLKKEKASK